MNRKPDHFDWSLFEVSVEELKMILTSDSSNDENINDKLDEVWSTRRES